ncbi:MAG: RNA methyltransferase, partial [Parcubacteria group bacterium QH_9_35_7]
SGYTPTPGGKRKIEKVALGAEKWVQWEQVDDTTELIRELKDRDFEIVGLEKTETSVNIDKANFTGKIALIVGEEVSGMDLDLVDLCDQVVHIPMYGKKSSLNVSVAAGVALHSIIT